jgi:DNA-binding NarL/FixJ family response regulator
VYEGYLRFPAVVASGSISKELADRRVHIPQISNREYDFLKLCRDGFRNAEIAKRMYVSEKTVEHYQHSLFEKMQVSSRVGLVLRASECGIL